MIRSGLIGPTWTTDPTENIAFAIVLAGSSEAEGFRRLARSAVPPETEKIFDERIIHRRIWKQRSWRRPCMPAGRSSGIEPPIFGWPAVICLIHEVESAFLCRKSASRRSRNGRPGSIYLTDSKARSTARFSSLLKALKVLRIDQRIWITASIVDCGLIKLFAFVGALPIA